VFARNQTLRNQPRAQISSTKFRRVLSFGSVLLAGLGLSLLAFVAVNHWEENRTRTEVEFYFQQQAQDRATAIQREIDTHFLALHALFALYSSSERVTQSEFKNFTSTLLQRIPSLQALEWIPRVAAADRAKFEARHRQPGHTPAFRITQRNAQGALVPATPREQYYPVGFVEPLQANLAAVGFDLASESTRREALERACDQGEITVSGPVLLVQEPTLPTIQQRAMLSFLPVYRDGSIPDTRVERRRKLLGFVLAVSRIGDLVKTAVSQFTARDIRLQVFDRTQFARPLLLHHHPSQALADTSTEMTQDTPALPPAEFSLNIGGRQWQVIATAAPGYFQPGISDQAWLVLTTGLILTALIGWYIWTLQCYSDKLQRLNRTYRVLSDHNHSLARASNEQGLLDAFCRILVQTGGYRFAWVGYALHDGRTGMQIVAQAGTMHRTTAEIAGYCGNNDQRTTVCGSVIETGTPLILTNLRDSGRFLLWRNNALGHGYRSMIALPLKTDGQPFGSLNLFSADRNPFDADETALLTVLAAGLSFGIETQQARQTQQQQVRRLREEVEQEERLRLVATLHDGVGQSVQAINLGLKRLRMTGNSETQLQASLLDTLIHETSEIIGEIRGISHDLRPLSSSDSDLTEAVRQHCDLLNQRSPIPISCRISPLAGVIAARVQEQCFLVFREALGNAVKHSRATTIDISLKAHSKQAAALRINDDGIGFDPNSTFPHPAGLGLSMMAERINSVDGHIDICSTKGQGTTITITIPYATTKPPLPANDVNHHTNNKACQRPDGPNIPAYTAEKIQNQNQ